MTRLLVTVPTAVLTKWTNLWTSRVIDCQIGTLGIQNVISQIDRIIRTTKHTMVANTLDLAHPSLNASPAHHVSSSFRPPLCSSRTPHFRITADHAAQVSPAGASRGVVPRGR